MEKEQKIKVCNKADRLTVAAILVDNGYKVWMGKNKSQADKRRNEICIYYEDQMQ